MAKNKNKTEKNHLSEKHSISVIRDENLVSNFHKLCKNVFKDPIKSGADLDKSLRKNMTDIRLTSAVLCNELGVFHPAIVKTGVIFDSEIKEPLSLFIKNNEYKISIKAHVKTSDVPKGSIIRPGDKGHAELIIEDQSQPLMIWVFPTIELSETHRRVSLWSHKEYKSIAKAIMTGILIMVSHEMTHQYQIHSGEFVYHNIDGVKDGDYTNEMDCQAYGQVQAPLEILTGEGSTLLKYMTKFKEGDESLELFKNYFYKSIKRLGIKDIELRILSIKEKS